MSTPNDGGPAYPATESRNKDGMAYLSDATTKIMSRGGMTMRQAYKIAALQGIIRHPDAIGEAEDVIAAWCAAAADACVAEDEAHAKKQEKSP